MDQQNSQPVMQSVTPPVTQQPVQEKPETPEQEAELLKPKQKQAAKWQIIIITILTTIIAVGLGYYFLSP